MAPECSVQDCHVTATEILLWQPSEGMVLDGGLSAAMRCGNHPASAYQEQLAGYDPGATFWVIRRGDRQPLAPGSYTASKGSW